MTNASGLAALTCAGMSARSTSTAADLNAAPSALSSAVRSLTWLGWIPTVTTGWLDTMGWPLPSRIWPRCVSDRFTASLSPVLSCGFTVLAPKYGSHFPSLSLAFTVVWYAQSTLYATGQLTATVAVAVAPFTAGLPASLSVGERPARSPSSVVSWVFAVSAGSGWPSSPSIDSPVKSPFAQADRNVPSGLSGAGVDEHAGRPAARPRPSRAAAIRWRMVVGPPRSWHPMVACTQP